VLWNWHRDPDLGPLAEAWGAAAAAGTGSVFQGFRFARHWAACFADAVEFKIAWSAAPPAVVPMIVRDGVAALLGDGLFDYVDLIGPPGRDVPPPCGAPARFTGVPAASPHARFWGAMAAEPFSAAPVRAPGPDPAQTHPRAARRFEAAGVELRLAECERERLRLLEWLLGQKAQACGAANVLGEREQRWLRAMVEHEPRDCELWSLSRRGETMAGLLCWRSRGVRYGYTIAYDARWASLSPGVLVLFAVLRHTMKEGRSFNFLTGEQAYKLRFATHCERLLRYRNAQ